MRKKEQNEVWIMWMVKALLAAYVVTGILLIILALALYKFELNEAGVTAVYLISTFTGGLVVGKLAKVRRFLWGIVLGILYFALLLLVTVGIYRTFHGSSTEILVTFALCAGGGMAGGMIS